MSEQVRTSSCVIVLCEEHGFYVYPRDVEVLPIGFTAYNPLPTLRNGGRQCPVCRGISPVFYGRLVGDQPQGEKKGGG